MKKESGNMAYTKTTWIDGQSPGISADKLNKIENELANHYSVFPQVKVEDSVYLDNTSEKILGEIDNNYTVIYATISFYENDDSTNPISTNLGETYTIYPSIRSRYISINAYHPDTKSQQSVGIVWHGSYNQIIILNTPPSFVGLYAKVTWVYKEV
jgi:hypothetical protein